MKRLAREFVARTTTFISGACLSGQFDPTLRSADLCHAVPNEKWHEGALMGANFLAEKRSK
jgi:hypothetical protein